MTEFRRCNLYLIFAGDNPRLWIRFWPPIYDSYSSIAIAAWGRHFHRNSKRNHCEIKKLSLWALLWDWRFDRLNLRPECRSSIYLSLSLSFSLFAWSTARTWKKILFVRVWCQAAERARCKSSPVLITNAFLRVIMLKLVICDIQMTVDKKK